MTSQDEKAGAALLGVVVLVAWIVSSLIYIARALYPVFEFLTVMSFFLGIVALILRSDEMVKWMAGSFVIMFALSWLTYGIGYSFGNSQLGRTAIQIDNAFDNISEAESEATMAVIDSSEQATDATLNETNSTHAREMEEDLDVVYDMSRTYVTITGFLPWTP